MSHRSAYSVSIPVVSRCFPVSFVGAGLTTDSDYTYRRNDIDMLVQLCKIDRFPGSIKMNVRQLRRRTRLSQEAFWNPIGVTQSGGSRYESGRDMPPPVQLLVKLRFGSTKQSKSIYNSLRHG